MRRPVKPKCKMCGGKVLYGDLHCSKRCIDGEAAIREAFHGRLLDAGFMRDSEASNIYRKDGVAVTQEHIRHVGLEKALQHHAQSARSAGPSAV